MTSLGQLLDAMACIAPLDYAESWDNVGLLVAPSAGREQTIHRVVLTIDMTPAVYDEAIENGADVIVAYHPPIFSGLKSLWPRDPKIACVIDAVRRGLAVYSPHTALDAAPGGINDWLIDGLGVSRDRAPLRTHAARGDGTHLVVARAVDSAIPLILDAFAAIGVVRASDDRRVELVVHGTALPAAASALANIGCVWDVTPLAERPVPGVGPGRRAALCAPVSLDTLVTRIKARLGLAHVRVAAAVRHRDGQAVESVAVCPGAGGSLFEGVSDVDLFLTGEMRHHDVLAQVASGASVVLTDHTNTERPYLPTLADRLRAALGDDLDVRVAKHDSDPLRIV